MGTFTVAGFSTYKGKLKLRFANDFITRTKLLQVKGHDPINLVELPEAMDKISAAKFIGDRFNDAEVQSAVEAFLQKRKVPVGNPAEAV